jgi:putative addiction module component (TIGR02574 family)
MNRRWTPRYTSRMGAEVLRLYEAVMQLSETDRTELIAMLIDNEDDGSTQEKIDAAWGVEVRRRMDEIVACHVQPIPLEDVLREGRELIEQAKRAS